MPSTAPQDRAAGQEGFTLVELLVVVLVIGILAAIAVPTLIGQRDKASDAGAKSAVRNAVTLMQACVNDTRSASSTAVASCTTDADVRGGIDPAIELSANGRDYAVSITSSSGGDFTITRTGTAFVRTCGAVRTSRGCRDGSW